MLRVSGEAANINFIVWFELIGARTHDLPHNDSLLYILTSLYAIIILLSHTQILYVLNAHQTY